MKIDKFLLLIIAFILLLSFTTYWQFKNFQRSLSKIKIPKFEIPRPEIFESKNKKEFISPDGKLKLTYPDDWTEMPKESLESFTRGLKKAKILFLAQKFKLEKAAFALLIVQEYGNGKNQEEIIAELKKEAKEKGGEMEVLNSKENYFEARYKRKNSTFLSKEKIIFSENKFYLVSIFSLEKDWPEFEKEANEILASIQYSP
jgi:hypothetical protein